MDNDSTKGIDYNMTIPMLLVRYFPTGMLGIGFTALMASFMSGMAGNVTAFNTVWTYDIYQSYIAPKKSDAHYLWMGRWATVAGILLSVGAAYWASKFGNIMILLQLVFSFVNAPLFATFLLGMFWRRTTGHGAFFGLLGGTERRLAVFPRHCFPQRDGTKLLDRNCRLDELFSPDDSDFAGDETNEEG